MSIVRWDPWKEFDQVRTQADKLWNEFLEKLSDAPGSTQRVCFMPDVDIVETLHDFRVYMSVPALIEEDIEIEVAPGLLTVRGERYPPYDADRNHIREWRYGFFERQLTVSKSISIEKVTADYDSGVLSIVMPKQTTAPTGAGGVDHE